MPNPTKQTKRKVVKGWIRVCPRNMFDGGWNFYTKKEPIKICPKCKITEATISYIIPNKKKK